ncbi:class I SAM-dependent methyltransferase [Propionibacteriaceae bacterium Y1923]
MGRWTEYISRFHHERPGLATEVLARCRAGEHNPHTWLARAVSGSSRRVVDIGCGSGPMSRMLERDGGTVLGLDLSWEEIQTAHRLGPGPFVQANGLALPVGSGAVDAVISSLALSVIEDTGALLDEVARVLRPGGMFAAITPTYRPINVTDMKLLGPLTARLKGPPRFPVRLDMRMGPILLEHGLKKIEDARERYYFDVSNLEDAEALLNALYLPTIGDFSVRRAAAWLAKRAADEGEPVRVPIPMRRVVAIKMRAEESSTEGPGTEAPN